MMKGGVLYYLHTDNLGSIQAITNESKTLISKYYYTPWGGRVLLSGVNITDRGYTFHEHLTEFGLINMNGRVYDPVLARFLSPDPYIQTPDYTQNFNRYSYCLNNPFKYTDPSGELFFLMPYFGYNTNGDFTFSLTAGIGIYKALDASITIGGSTSGNFSVSAGVSVAGFNAYVGWDNQIGWNAGAGFSFFSSNGFSSNLFSIGVNYSQYGGLSANYMGMQFSRGGVSFNPSVGMSFNKSFFYNSELNKLVLEMKGTGSSGNNEVAYTAENVEEMLKLFRIAGKLRKVYLGATVAGNEAYDPTSGTFGNGALAVTLALKQYNFRVSDMYLGKAAFENKRTLFIVLQHELVHVALNAAGYGFDYTKVRSGNREDIRRIAQEIAAYNVTRYQADAWNDTGWQNNAQNHFNEFSSVLNGYYYGSSGSMPNYSNLFNLSRIIRQVTPW